MIESSPMWRAHDMVCLSPVIASGSILRMPVKDYLRIILLVTTQTPENHAGVPSGVEVALLLGRIFRISVVECFSDFAQMFTQNDNTLEGQSMECFSLSTARRTSSSFGHANHLRPYLLNLQSATCFLALIFALVQWSQVAQSIFVSSFMKGSSILTD